MQNILYKIKNYFYSKEKIYSPKNGEIIVKKRLFSYEIWNGNCFQSGPYVDHLWRKLLTKVPKKTRPKKILLLGLGGGGGIKEIIKRFRLVKIDAIEHDPIMVEIAKSTYLKKSYPSLQIIITDALNFIKNSQEKFDVIMVDLFKGKTPAPIIESDEFLICINKILDKEGYLLINFYKNKSNLAPKFNKYFSCWKNLQYWFNQMAVYRNFGQGNPNDPLPKGFLNKEQSLIYLKGEIKNLKKEKIIGEKGCFGISKKFRIFTYQKYISPIEPKISDINKLGIIFWQPINKFVKSTGWIYNLFGKRLSKKIGVEVLENIDYWQNWTKHAQRHREKWLKSQQYEIIETDINTFAQAYHDSKLTDIILRKGMIRVIKFHLARHPADVHLFVAKKKDDPLIIGGLAVIDYPDVSQSTHVISFLNRNVPKTSVGVGLIDHWHQYCLKKNIKFLNFGRFWKKGDPRKWQGFSNFKKQFNVYQFFYPHSYIKFVGFKK